MYESDPNGYVNAGHEWFDPKDAETEKTLTKMYLDAVSVILTWNTYSLFIFSVYELLYRKYFMHQLH